MITFDSIHQTYVTFAAAEGFDGSQPCKLTANGTVGACAAGDEFVGVAGVTREGIVGVAMGGFVTLPYSGTAPALGYGTLAADGNGGVKTASTGRRCCVAEVDTVAKTVGLFL